MRLDEARGLAPGVIAIPDAAQRLRTDDPDRMKKLALSTCLAYVLVSLACASAHAQRLQWNEDWPRFRDLGYWLQIAGGAIGVVVFFASINDALGDRRPGLNPWIAALGALSGLVFAAGPLVPEGLAVWSDNWYVTEGPGAWPALLLSGRLVQLAILALTTVVGFLTVRRWGLGVAIGGGLPAIWLLISTAFELSDRPAGPAYLNPGATDGVHGVTIIGATALAVFAVLALAAAYDQNRRW